MFIRNVKQFFLSGYNIFLIARYEDFSCSKSLPELDIVDFSNFVFLFLAANRKESDKFRLHISIR